MMIFDANYRNMDHERQEVRAADANTRMKSIGEALIRPAQLFTCDMRHTDPLSAPKSNLRTFHIQTAEQNCILIALPLQKH